MRKVLQDNVKHLILIISKFENNNHGYQNNQVHEITI